MKLPSWWKKIRHKLFVTLNTCEIQCVVENKKIPSRTRHLPKTSTIYNFTFFSIIDFLSDIFEALHVNHCPHNFLLFACMIA